MVTRYARCWAPAVVVVALLSAPLWGAVGDLKYAKGPSAGRGISVRFTTPRKIEGNGTNGLPKGTIVLAGGTMAGSRVSAALTGAKALDTLRLDLTGKGEFRSAAKVPVRTLRKTATSYSAMIGPAQVSLTKGGQAIPVTVSGHYYESRGRPRLYVTLTAAVEGTCAFGSTRRAVRITDASGNLRFSDAHTGSGRGAADLVQIADENGQFPGGSRGTPLGDPVQIGGTWYTVAVKGMTVSAARATCPMGKIAGKGENWQLSLRGRKYTFTVNGGAEPVTVPADTYQVMRCNYFHTGPQGKTRAMVSTYPHLSVQVPTGKTVPVPMGLPIKASIQATVRRGNVYLNVARTDSAGNRILSVRNTRGGRPKAPSIDVVDKTGKVVYTAQLGYG